MRKWLDQGWQTLKLLKAHRPTLLFVQNPSLGLTVLALAARPFFRYCLVVDAHNEGVRPFVRSSAFVRRLTRLLLKKSDVTIVTNEALAEQVRDAGGTPRVLPDRLPCVPDAVDVSSQAHDPSLVVVVSTFAPDEPIREILEAAAGMPELKFSITGNAEKLRRRARSVPSNVRLTGFLPDADYWSLLAHAAVIVDLTLMPDCLVCGAYEGLAVGRPLVLTDNEAGRALFGAAAVFCDPSAEDIVASVRAAISNQASIAANAQAHRKRFTLEWQRRADALISELKAMSERHKTTMAGSKV